MATESQVRYITDLMKRTGHADGGGAIQPSAKTAKVPYIRSTDIDHNVKRWAETLAGIHASDVIDMLKEELGYD